MCFKKPKMPATPPNDPELARANREAREAAQVERMLAKDRRLEERLAMMEGRFGRTSLITGAKGGQGFAAPAARSLFVPRG